MDKITPKSDMFKANCDRVAPLLANLKTDGIGHIIEGNIVPSISGETFQTKSPVDGTVLASVARGNAQDIDRAVGDTKAYSPYLTIWLSEFQRIRLQYTYLDAPGNHENQFFLQWTAILGSHVHGFRDR